MYAYLSISDIGHAQNFIRRRTTLFRPFMNQIPHQRLTPCHRLVKGTKTERNPSHGRTK